jgi:glucan phosphorylase
MKKIIKVLSVITIIFALSSFISIDKETEYKKVVNQTTFEIPDNIQLILEKSCVGCHNSKSKAKKAKIKFNIEKLTNGKYSQKRVASKLRKIVKLINEDNEKKMMPPKKFVIYYPDRAISKEEIRVLTKWAKKQNSILN